MHRHGLEVPALDNRPDVYGLTWLLKAFWDLHTCRSFGMVAGPIPWTAIEQYATSEDFLFWEKEMLHEVIRHMDGRWLEYQTELAKRAGKKGQKKR